MDENEEVSVFQLAEDKDGDADSNLSSTEYDWQIEGLDGLAADQIRHMEAFYRLLSGGTPRRNTRLCAWREAKNCHCLLKAVWFFVFRPGKALKEIHLPTIAGSN